MRDANGDTRWRTITRDNITTWYGRTPESRQRSCRSNPHLSWLICQSYDDKGNAVRYEYAAESSDRILKTPRGNRLRLPTSATAPMRRAPQIATSSGVF